MTAASLGGCWSSCPSRPASRSWTTCWRTSTGSGGPAHTIYVLDVSGSMQGDRIESLKQTLANLTGAATFKEIRGYQ